MRSQRRAWLISLLLGPIGMSTFIYRPFERGSHLDALRERYGTQGEPQGPRFMRQHIQLGPVRWRFCTAVVVAATGLYLRISPPGKSTELLVPWSEFAAAQKAILYWMPCARLSVGQPEVVGLVVARKVYEAARPYLPWAPELF
jgi:hypothetical protein